MLIRVAVPVPQLDLLTYRVPSGASRPAIGARVLVPLGSRVVTGIVAGLDEGQASAEVEARDIKTVREVLDVDAFVPEDVVALAMWTADYYAAGPGEALLAVLPPKTRGGRADAHKTRRIAAITPAGLGVLEAAAGSTFAAEQDIRLSPKQRELLEALSGVPEGIPVAEMSRRGMTSSVLGRLASRGLVSMRNDRVDRDPFAGQPLGDAPMAPQPELTEEQASAFARLSALAREGAFRVALLYGVTGSGKTELYVRTAADVVASGRTVLMLVPEIALTPAVAARFRQTFGERVAIQHSAMSEGERHDQWQRIRAGDVDVVVGTRSAVFAPLGRLGLVIVDEEHDASYKQEESPRYHGRDVAIVRAQRAGALALLGSATPSMESYQHAMSGKYERLVLSRRVLDRPLATVHIVDMREEYAAVGPDVVLSRALVEGIRQRLERREQSLVLLNRRGFATSVFCRQCAGTLDCPNCSVSLVVHGQGAGRIARCHYCNYATRVPGACALCAAPYLDYAGFGTERVEAEVVRLFPEARVARLDRDATRRRGVLQELLAKFRAGAIDVLVGTQMIAKGHDVPRVTLVGVISADVGLGLADFRASERTFQILTQVAGRAGRGERPGEAVVQTIYPGHYSVQLACQQDYPQFFERELHFRRSMRYPPLLSLVNVVVRGRTFAGAMEDATDIAAQLGQTSTGVVRVLGPAPAPIAKLRGEYRAQILLKGTNRTQMREALQRILSGRPDLARRTIVDVDPLSVL